MLLHTPARAQAVDSQFWLTGSATVDLAKQMPVGLDTALRFSDHGNGLYEWARGGWIGVRTDGGTEILGGYQRVTGYTGGRVTKLEQRIRQQISANIGKLWGGTINARLRVEERLRRGGDGVGLRARTQVRYTLPLAKRKGAAAVVLTHESFWEVNDTRWGQESGLRRTRNLVGLDIPVSKTLRAQIGYLNQYDFGITGKRDAMANILVFGLNARF